MPTYKIDYITGAPEEIEADSFDLKECPGWVTFHKGGTISDRVSAGSMKRPPTELPPGPTREEEYARMTTLQAHAKLSAKAQQGMRLRR